MPLPCPARCLAHDLVDLERISQLLGPITSQWLKLHPYLCDRVRPHTLIVGIGDTTTFPFFFYFLNPTATLLGRRLHSHLPVAEVALHGRGPLAAGGQSARRSWLVGRLSARRCKGGSAAAAARDDMMKLGSCPSLLQPPCHIQITPVIWVGISKGIRGYPPYYNWGVVPGVLSDALGHTTFHVNGYTHMQYKLSLQCSFNSSKKNVSVPSTLHSEIAWMHAINKV